MLSFLNCRRAFWVLCMCTSSTFLQAVFIDAAFGRNYRVACGASPLERVISRIKGDPEEADSSSRKWLQYAEHQSRQIRALHSHKLPCKAISTSSSPAGAQQNQHNTNTSAGPVSNSPDRANGRLRRNTDTKNRKFQLNILLRFIFGLFGFILKGQ